MKGACLIKFSFILFVQSRHHKNVNNAFWKGGWNVVVLLDANSKQWENTLGKTLLAWKILLWCAELEAATYVWSHFLAELGAGPKS